MDYIWLPVYHAIEKQVAAQQIPPVARIPGRLKLKDCSLESDVFDHSVWDALLKKYVVPHVTFGRVSSVHAVDYAGIAEDPAFETYLQQLNEAVVSKLPKAEQLAFWMNAYNALCIGVIVKHEQRTNVPLKSITDLSKSNSIPVWDQVAGIVAGQAVSLNYVEHEQLREVWAEPAVHGCIVCASASCPNLRREAFVGSKVRQQMDDQMVHWMKNPTKGIKVEGNVIYLSRIFLWFQDDFAEGVRAWLSQYVDDDVTTALSRNIPIRYFEYDWQINRATPRESR